MSFSELVGAIAHATGLNRAVVARVLKSLPEEVRKALETDESVKLHGFGAFYIVETPKDRKIRFRQSRRK